MTAPRAPREPDPAEIRSEMFEIASVLSHRLDIVLHSLAIGDDFVVEMTLRNGAVEMDRLLEFLVRLREIRVARSKSTVVPLRKRSEG